ncbi:MAG TPA: NADH-quinone oxidoreductase subunit L [Candidatus Baltobacteraceae bacterium]|jgi:NADH-quinone oxidoreductase subunit L|nr:NADH-quinone oxidoreductase subunit L [Candidatus Baltobacteraceae bacterium]
MIHHVMGVDGSYPLLLALWLLPLAGAVVCWAFGPQLRNAAGWLGSATIGASFILTLLSWGAGTQSQGGALGAHQSLLSWMPGFDFGLLLDPLSLLWTLIITGVGFLIHFYSIGYMDGDRAFARFFAYMNFFVFAMLTLVLSDNFIGLLVGWGLVGLASYFLIGFWFERPSAVAAARKAFVMNVVGDVGMMFAIFLIVAHVHSISFGDGFAAAGTFGPQALIAICIGLFIGAAAKSAQVPLHTWLPDAMEGPTPVSALIHAATMVTAGVYLIARCAPFWNADPDAQLMVGIIGGLTALMGAVLGCAQWDIKRILAYSTMSQIGYMIMGVGVGAYEGGVAHFFTHAFFKAQLFLGSGLIIHALSNEQDVRRMGGLWKKMPFAFIAMLTGVLSICGFPFTSGYFSKDMDIYGALAEHHVGLFVVGIVTAGITAYYMFRLLFVTFFGKYRGHVDPSDLGIRHPELAGTALPSQAEEVHVAHEPAHHHAPSWIMNVPVAILILPSLLIGWLMFGGDSSPWARFFAPEFPGGPEGVVHPSTFLNEGMTSVIVLLVVVVGFAIAYWRYATKEAQADAVARLRTESVHMPPVLTNLFYFDAFYDLIVVRTSQLFGTIFGRALDPHVVDGAVREGVFITRWAGVFVQSLQTGLVRAYALVLVFGAACFIIYYATIGGAH